MKEKFGFLTICVLSFWISGCIISASPGKGERPVRLVIAPAGYLADTLKPNPLVLPQGGQESLRVFGKCPVSGKWSDVTDQVSWSSNNESIVMVYDKMPAKGYLTAVSKGTAVIKASLENLVETVEVAVMDAVLAAIRIHPFDSVVSSGESKQFEVIGIYTDNSIKDLSSEVAWKTSEKELAAINDTGSLTSFRPGAVTVSAGIGALSDTATLKILERSLEKISITPKEAAVPIGTLMNFKAEGVYSDGTVKDITAKIKWVSTNKNVACVDNFGLVVAKGVGKATIRALLDHCDIHSNEVELIIGVPTSSGISVSPVNFSLNVGDIVPFKAEGWDTNEQESKEVSGGVLWESTDESVAYIRYNDETPAIGAGPAVVGANTDAITGIAGLFAE